MPISYTVDEEARVIYEKWVGDIYATDLASYWKDYLKDPIVLEIRRTLVDLREAKVCFKGEDFSQLIPSIVLPILGKRTWKTAILVNEPYQYGVSMQYHVFADIYSCDAVFYDREKALSWLLDTTCPQTSHSS
ncbi:MAG: hypothetical protein ACLQF0_09570 [Dissulfurispiraceae bacterium]